MTHFKERRWYTPTEAINAAMNVCTCDREVKDQQEGPVHNQGCPSIAKYNELMAIERPWRTDLPASAFEGGVRGSDE